MGLEIQRYLLAPLRSTTGVNFSYVFEALKDGVRLRNRRPGLRLGWRVVYSSSDHKTEIRAAGHGRTENFSSQNGPNSTRQFNNQEGMSEVRSDPTISTSNRGLVWLPEMVEFEG